MKIASNHTGRLGQAWDSDSGKTFSGQEDKPGWIGEHCLVLVCVPLPQETLHDPKAVQSPQWHLNRELSTHVSWNLFKHQFYAMQWQ